MRSPRPFLHTALLITLSLVLTTGCFEEEDSQGLTSPGGGDCTPGASMGCTCTDGADGAQVCAADGKSLAPCVCGLEPDDDVHVDDVVEAETSLDDAVDEADGSEPVDAALDPDDSETVDAIEDTHSTDDTGLNPPDGSGEICEPDCSGKECGSDGCWGSCGVCAEDSYCSDEEVCVPEATGGDVIILTAEGDEVIPQTVIHLSANLTNWADGPATSYAWTVQQPPLSTSVFLPNASAPSPSFEANVAGTYRFHLTVQNETGESASAASFEVFVVPADTIHIELLWASPGDPNPSDSGPMSGTDLDLHFAHPNAAQPDLDGDAHPDPWFDPAWDCFWYYPGPDWGSPTSQNDNPRLDRDDVDSGGPENLNLAVPEDGVSYAFGVNYWDDHGFGVALPTIRVFIYSQLVHEMTGINLVKHDMWWAGNLAWPSGEVTSKVTADGSPWITHEYKNDNFYQP
jgi:K319L-like, PKD domain